MIAFLGGTIGNLDPTQRARFLFDLNCTMSSDDSLLLGTDLVKDRGRLVAAYDDAAGVTADFNRNVLHVLNEQLGGDFEPVTLSARRSLERRRAVDRDAAARRGGDRRGARRGRHYGALRRRRRPPHRDQRQVHARARRGGAGPRRDSCSRGCGAPTTGSSSSRWRTPTAEARSRERSGAPPHPTDAGTRAADSSAGPAASSPTPSPAGRRRLTTSQRPKSKSSRATRAEAQHAGQPRCGGR